MSPVPREVSRKHCITDPEQVKLLDFESSSSSSMPPLQSSASTFSKINAIRADNEMYNNSISGKMSREYFNGNGNGNGNGMNSMGDLAQLSPYYPGNYPRSPRSPYAKSVTGSRQAALSRGSNSRYSSSRGGLNNDQYDNENDNYPDEVDNNNSLIIEETPMKETNLYRNRQFDKDQQMLEDEKAHWSSVHANLISHQDVAQESFSLIKEELTMARDEIKAINSRRKAAKSSLSKWKRKFAIENGTEANEADKLANVADLVEVLDKVESLLSEKLSKITNASSYILDTKKSIEDIESHLIIAAERAERGVSRENRSFNEKYLAPAVKESVKTPFIYYTNQNKLPSALKKEGREIGSASEREVSFQLDTTIVPAGSLDTSSGINISYNEAKAETETETVSSTAKKSKSGENHGVIIDSSEFYIENDGEMSINDNEPKPAVDKLRVDSSIVSSSEDFSPSILSPIFEEKAKYHDFPNVKNQNVDVVAESSAFSQTIASSDKKNNIEKNDKKKATNQVNTNSLKKQSASNTTATTTTTTTTTTSTVEKQEVKNSKSNINRLSSNKLSTNRDDDSKKSNLASKVSVPKLNLTKVNPAVSNPKKVVSSDLEVATKTESVNITSQPIAQKQSDIGPVTQASQSIQES